MEILVFFKRCQHVTASVGPVILFPGKFLRPQTTTATGKEPCVLRVIWLTGAMSAMALGKGHL